ncbi:MAG TPA: M23 family metallopeptidase [Candidatus Peribacteraceae bacterium]|nr:M23 family metallopeptidase [Candidatus Peribacteraceae bacterium]
MEHTDRYRHLHRPYVRILISGLIIGAVAQMASQTSQDQARLFSDVATPYYRDARHQVVALAVPKKTLLTSAARHNEAFMVAMDDAQTIDLHNAAPVDAASASSIDTSVPTIIDEEAPVLVIPLSSSSSSDSSADAASPTPGVVPVVQREQTSSAQAVSASASSSSSSPAQIPPPATPSSSPADATSQSDAFPPFIRTVWPIGKVPNWGAMRTPSEWDRTYKQMQPGDFVGIPAYNMSVLTTPMDQLSNDLTPANIAKITAKLFYSTRYFGAYDLDAGEFSGTHPAVDLKLARGTPVGAIAGGKVIGVVRDDGGLGLHVLIEHHLPDGKKFISIYGHLDSAAVREGDTVTPGQYIGNVGMTGNTTAPHLHLQVDIDDGTNPHQVYAPLTIPSPAEASKHTVNPITFIQTYAGGVQ